MAIWCGPCNSRGAEPMRRKKMSEVANIDPWRAPLPVTVPYAMRTSYEDVSGVPIVQRTAQFFDR